MHDQSQNSQHGLVQFTCGIALAVIFCWILVIGQSLIVPILLGVIGVYLFVSAADGLAKFGPFKGLRRLWRRLIVVLLALLLIAVLADFLVRNSFNIASALPVYGSNLSQMLSPYLESFSAMIGYSLTELFDAISAYLDFETIATSLVGLIYSLAAALVSALIYGLFLGFELDDLPVKTKKALNGVGNAGNAIKMIQKINQRIAGYLSAKTAINVILGALSLVVMLLIGIEFAVLWALLIAVLNYIPYIGSIVGVVFPTLIGLAQNGSLTTGLLALIGLMCVQLFVGYVLEPKMLGKSANLSPFFVLVSLAIWIALWGSMGAILAIPLTSALLIILSEFHSTRPLAVIMSENGDV